MIDLAIIGGTTFQSMPTFGERETLAIETQYAESLVSIAVGNMQDKRVAFLNRHGENYQIPPHKINYRANIDALHQLGVKNIIAINTVGGISDFAEPLHLSIPDQVIDYSYAREHSFFNGEQKDMHFIDFTEPFSGVLREHLITASRLLKLEDALPGLSTKSCYACTQGPRLETAAEITRLKQDGCDLVGMTLMPEAALAREKNIEYASVCLVVNWAAGITDSSVSLPEIKSFIEQGATTIQALLESFVSNLP